MICITTFIHQNNAIKIEVSTPKPSKGRLPAWWWWHLHAPEPRPVPKRKAPKTGGLPYTFMIIDVH